MTMVFTVCGQKLLTNITCIVILLVTAAAPPVLHNIATIKVFSVS